MAPPVWYSTPKGRWISTGKGVVNFSVPGLCVHNFYFLPGGTRPGGASGGRAFPSLGGGVGNFEWDRGGKRLKPGGRGGPPQTGAFPGAGGPGGAAYKRAAQPDPGMGERGEKGAQGPKWEPGGAESRRGKKKKMGGVGGGGEIL